MSLAATAAPSGRDACVALDREDPLGPLRDQFDLPPGTIYLDGNSLGVLPRATAPRIEQVVRQEWGRGLITSWNAAEWMNLPQRIGDKIARLVGAGRGELVATDSTSVNLFKVLSVAVSIAREASPQRRVILSELANFPTDLYIAEALARDRGLELRLVEPEEITSQLDASTAVLMLTEVNYRSGRLHDMAALTQAAHRAGALTVWDLAHSAGALPVDLTGSDADFAVGCGYKYLNGGPGAPAFVWAHPRHAGRVRQPLAGWIGHAAPFEFTPHYEPAPDIRRYLCGSPPVLGLAALECGVDTLLAAEPLGGMVAIRAKSIALCELFVQLVATRCAGHGLDLASPRDPAMRGSQVCFSHPEIGYPVIQALIARGVIGDFRAGSKAGETPVVPDILRFGFTPLYTRYVDVWDGVEHLRSVLDGGEWRRPEFNRRQPVT